MDNMVHEMKHPLIKHKISIIRSKDTPTKDFRDLVYEISLLMGYEATYDLELTEAPVTTPLTETTGSFINKQVAIVPILRAGLAMSDALMSLIPASKVGHVGLYRDPETHQPVEYYCKLPTDIDQRQALVVDPMLATGGSAAAAINFIKRRGAKKIKFMCLIASPEGIEVLRQAHPDVEIFCGAIDECLNENKYIVPGLGDAGDRIFGTL